MKNLETPGSFEETKKLKETHLTPEQEINNHMVAGLNKLVKEGEKYKTFKYEDDKNREVKYNVGIQRLHDGHAVLLMDPKDRDKILKGIFKPDKKPEFFEITMETKKGEGVTKKEDEKKIPSNPQVAKNFMAIVGEVNKIELTKKQGN